MHPGLLLKEITTADGFTRAMNHSDHSYLQIMKQLTVAPRPFICTFEPRTAPMEFTLDDSSHGTTVPSPSSSEPDSSYARYAHYAMHLDHACCGFPVPYTNCTLCRHCNKFGYNVFRHLGLSLREEVVHIAGSETATKRCRVSGVIPGGMVSLRPSLLSTCIEPRASIHSWVDRAHSLTGRMAAD